MFDSAETCKYNSISPAEIDTPEHEQLALKAARESLVLLKNDGVLPLNPNKYRQVAVIGPVAKSQSVLVGNYNGTPARPVTLFDGLQKKFQATGATVEYAEGSRLVNLGKGVGMLPRGSIFSNESRTEPGLKGEVFGNPELQGTAAATRTDRFLNLHWSTDQPLAGVPSENCSIRWTGYLVWPSDAEVLLGVSVQGGVRLFLDDKLVIDQWKNRQLQTFRVNQAFKKGASVKVRLEYTHGLGAAAIQFGSNPTEKVSDYTEAENLAKRSDLLILTLGITPQLEGEQMPVQYDGFAGGDRTSILLPEPQRELLRRMAATGKPVIVVLTTGSAVSFNPSLANGILLQWYSGEQGGNAVADALVGDVNPSGRLPITFYQSDKDLPAFENYHLDGRTYRYFRGKPLFPFGFGLSYARFKYESAKIEKAADGHSVSVPVTNTSSVAGDEVVQIYARYGRPSKSDPIRRLVGFQRVSLAAGERKVVNVDLTNWALRSWNEEHHAYELRSGEYRLEIGPYAGKALQSQTLSLP